MNNGPFQCGKCANWYTPVPAMKGQACWQCEAGVHAPHAKTGVIDCHFGQESATISEIRMASLVLQGTAFKNEAQDIAGHIGNAKTRQAVDASLLRAETLFAAFEKSMGDLPEIVRWAGVFELPGLRGDPVVKRFKDMAAMEELVDNNRRPPEDLATLRRSTAVCDQLSAELTPMLVEARTIIGSLRQLAQGWEAPAAARQLPTEAGMDKWHQARANKKAQRERELVNA